MEPAPHVPPEPASASAEPGPYAELAAYLARLPAADRARTPDALLARMRSVRAASAAIKRLAHLLKLASTPALLLGLAVMIAAIAAPTSLAGDYAIPAFHAVTVAILAKLFLPLVDLETRAIQFAAIVLLTALFSLTGTPEPLVPISTGIAFAVLCLVSRQVRAAAKLRALSWMMREPGRVPPAADALESATLGALAAARVPLFGDSRFVRTFEVKGKGRARSISLVDTRDPLSPPPKNHVRVEVWRRDPRKDLSAIREFFVCCFLGGSQDASAFDFLLSRTVTMLDFVSPKGRTLRALLLAAREKDLGPVLVVDAVFGRDGGLVGGVADDDAFVRAQIEHYARVCGFQHVLVATTPTNRRPRLFLESAAAARALPVEASVSIELFSRAPLKVEVFDRVRGRSLYIMLLAEIFNLTDSYATHGRVRGAWLRGGPREQEPPPVDAPARPDALEARTRNTTIAVDAGLASPVVGEILTGCLERIPGMDGFGAPERVQVRLAAESGPVANDGWQAPLLVTPCASPDPFVREVEAALDVLGALLARIHPKPIDATIAALEKLGTSFEDRLVASSSAFRALDETRELPSAVSGWVLAKRALRRRYDATKVFKAKELYGWIRSRPPAELGDGPGRLCRAFLTEKAATYEGFRDKFLGGIPGETREAVLDAMAESLEEIVRRLPFIESVPMPIAGSEDEILEDLASMEKEAKRLGIEVPPEVTARIEASRARAKRLQQLAEVESMIAHKKEKPALEAIAKLLAAADLESADRVRLARAAKKARTARFDRFIERLNVDGLF